MDRSTSTGPASAHQFGDMFAVLIGMSLLGMALYGGSLIATGEGDEIRNGQLVWLAYFLSGTIALIATGMAQWEKHQAKARLLLALDGLALLGGLFAFYNFGWRALVTIALPGAALIVLSRFLGPLPPPKTATARRT
jgi:hypothetical protein